VKKVGPVPVTALTLALLIAFMHPAHSSQVTNPLYDKYKGLLASWHEAQICMPCHINTLPSKEVDRFVSCTPCHNKNLNLNDQEQLMKIHGVNVCIKCHVGSVYNSENLGLKVHVPHSHLPCSTCHGGDGAIAKPDSDKCTECHGSNPHSVHSRILDTICFDCHSEYMKDYLPEVGGKVLEAAGLQPTPTPPPEKQEVSFKSLSDLILWIVNLIL